MSWQSLLPQLSHKRVAIHLKPSIEGIVRAGHPWIFDQAITKYPADAHTGDIAVIYDRKNRFMGLGLYDATSPIRVKMLHIGAPVALDEAWFTARLHQAIARRAPLADTQTDGYRVVHGENDGLPALIIDRYADTLVIKLYSEAWLPHLPALLAALEAVLPLPRWVLRLNRAMQAGDMSLRDGMILKGEPLTAPIVFHENGLRFMADVIQGHKTGFFFDQRDNRHLVSTLAHGKRVLDVFAYVGAFAVYSLWGGASSVTSTDISAPALDLARQHVALNQAQLASTQFETIVGDAFVVLDKLHRERRTFDMVIIDPPSFAKSQAEVGGALKAYSDLTYAGLHLLERNGILVMASCSSRVSADDFFRTVNHTASQSGRKLIEIQRTAHALDHPIGFSEGAYLKCLFARA